MLQFIMLLPPDSDGEVVMFLGCPIVPYVRSTGQILLPQSHERLEQLLEKLTGIFISSHLWPN